MTDIFKPIPTDVRQFKLAGIFKLTFVVALAVWLWPMAPFFGAALLGAICGYVLLVVSDVIDHRPFEDRVWISNFFNVIGILMIAICFAGGLVTVFEFGWRIALYSFGVGSN